MESNAVFVVRTDMHFEETWIMGVHSTLDRAVRDVIERLWALEDTKEEMLETIPLFFGRKHLQMNKVELYQHLYKYGVVISSNNKYEINKFIVNGDQVEDLFPQPLPKGWSI